MIKLAEIDVEYRDHMGSDLSVVNAARVSFDKEHEEFEYLSDKKLIKYLAEHNHWSPFAHVSATFRVKAPIFVARQLVKHTVGFAWNEVSRRYVDHTPEFFIPPVWRGKPEGSIKQGSSGEVAVHHGVIRSTTAIALKTYEDLLASGVCPEQARMVLPQNTMTEWIWTGTLYAWARMCVLRLDNHTQLETREVAKAVDRNMKSLFPYSWEYLVPKKDKLCALLS
jgi:thymidylate synthase (FAD)